MRKIWSYWFSNPNRLLFNRYFFPRRELRFVCYESSDPLDIALSTVSIERKLVSCRYILANRSDFETMCAYVCHNSGIPLRGSYGAFSGRGSWPMTIEIEPVTLLARRLSVSPRNRLVLRGSEQLSRSASLFVRRMHNARCLCWRAILKAALFWRENGFVIVSPARAHDNKFVVLRIKAYWSFKVWENGYSEKTKEEIEVG